MYYLPYSHVQGQAHLFDKINNNAFIIYFSNKIKVIQVNTQIKVKKISTLSPKQIEGGISAVV